jgi:hypothetical protein
MPKAIPDIKGLKRRSNSACWAVVNCSWGSSIRRLMPVVLWGHDGWVTAVAISVDGS